ncbi:hypothetical protein ACHAXN_007057 [Cyclotella atomus]
MGLPLLPPVSYLSRSISPTMKQSYRYNLNGCIPFLLLALLCHLTNGSKPRTDQFAECEEWAERGDCGANGRPYFMQQNCPEACHKKTSRAPELRSVPDNNDFFDLKAKDANGKVLSMENFEGYVTVIVNGARVCDHSELFYNSLEHMHSINPYTVEILAFPFDHPNITTTSCIDDLRAIEKRKDRKIHVMKPVEINGPNTHPVFKYLKKLFDIEDMEPNYAHYFFINPDGDMVELHRGASYNALKTFIDMHVKEDLRVKKKWEL